MIPRVDYETIKHKQRIKRKQRIAGLLTHTLSYLSLSICSFVAYADNTRINDAVAVELLAGSDNIYGVRLALRSYEYQLTQIPLFDSVDIYWEVSANIWKYDGEQKHQTNYVLALSPVVRKTLYVVKDKYPLSLEAGIGLSLIKDTMIAGRDLGSHYQFEDRIGLSVDYGDNLQHSQSVRYMHYSNAGVSSKNKGVDFLNIAYAYQF